MRVATLFSVLWLLASVRGWCVEPSMADLPFARWQRKADAKPWQELGMAPLQVVVQPGSIYFILGQRPAGGEISFPRLNNVVRRAWWDSIGARSAPDIPHSSNATLADSEYTRPFLPPRDQLLPFSQSPATWTIRVDESVTYPAVVVLDVERQPRMAIEAAVSRAGRDGVVTLSAHDAIVHGEKLQFEPLAHKNTVGYWVDAADWAEWRLATDRGGEWDVHLYQGCGNGQGGSEVAIGIGGQVVAFQVQETGHFQNFRWRVVGRVTLPASESLRLEARCRRLARNAVMDIRQIRLVPVDRPMTLGDCHDIAPDIFVPPLTSDEPAAGRRFVMQAPGYEPTRAYHVLSLPTDWDRNREYPVIVEFTGNGPFENARGDRCTGRVEDAKLGCGVAGNDGYLWLSLPCLNAAGTANVMQWWGSPPEHRPESTVEYALRAIGQTCRDFGGDPDRLVLAGFSRGSLACNAIGLHDDRIARLWRAFICYSHYDGLRPWPYADSDSTAAIGRLARLGGRPQYICAESALVGPGSPASVRQYLDAAGIRGSFTFAETGFANHDDGWLLRPSAARDAIRSWLRDVVARDGP